MRVRYQLLIAAFVACLAGGLVWAALHYHGKYLDEQQRAETAEHSLNLANATIADMQTRQRDVAALDGKYTGELADAKAVIDKLHNDVAAGNRRLQLNASCKQVPRTTSTASVDDAPIARLTDAAERDYFSLRERIETSRTMIAGLQDYIRQQCLGERYKFR